MRKTLTVAAVTFLTASAVGPVIALSPSPLASQGRAALVRVSVPMGRHVSMNLDIRAVQNSDGSSLQVSRQTCDPNECSQTTTFAAPLSRSEFTVDESAASASLDTTVDGVGLVVHWTPSATGGVVIESSQVEGNGSGDSGYIGGKGAPADVTVSIGNARCVGGGNVSAAYDFSVGGSAYASLSEFEMPRASTIAC